MSHRFGLAIRDRWMLDPDVAFLNHGSFGACPRDVLAVQRALMDRMERQPVSFMAGAWEMAAEAVEAPARLIGARPADCVFVDNATTGVNAVLRSLALGPADAIVTTSHVYGAVRQALHYVGWRSGARIVEVPVPFPLPDPAVVVDALTRAIDETPGVRLAVIDHITSATGLILPIAELVAACRQRGVPVLVDAAHVPGHLPVDVPALGADWWTGNLHKWAFAPKGSAVLWTAPARQATTRPLVISHGHQEGYHREFHWQGTKDPSPWLATPAAIAFHEDLGPDAIWAYNQDLARRQGDRLAAAWGTERPAPAEMCGAMVTLRPPIDLPGTLEAADRLHDALLHEFRVEVPCMPFAGAVWLRISAQVYNHDGDYDRLADAMDALRRRSWDA